MQKSDTAAKDKGGGGEVLEVSVHLRVNCAQTRVIKRKLNERNANWMFFY